jgi:hypothetical protein
LMVAKTLVSRDFVYHVGVHLGAELWKRGGILGQVKIYYWLPKLYSESNFKSLYKR